MRRSGRDAGPCVSLPRCGRLCRSGAPDLVTPKLPALRDYQHSLSPPPLPGRIYGPRRYRNRRCIVRGDQGWHAPSRTSKSSWKMLLSAPPCHSQAPMSGAPNSRGNPLPR